MVPDTRPARGDLLSSAVLGVLGSQGPRSRADLARLLEVSPAAVTQATKNLLARGLVTELDQSPSRGGRPARLLGLTGPPSRALGAKVTADHVAVVDVELDGTVHSASSHSFDPDAPDALDRLGHILRAVIAERGDLGLLGVGVGVPGSVDGQATGVVNAPTLGWIEAPVGDVLRGGLGVPVLVENDVNTLAVAAGLYGAGRAYSSYLVVTIGRGIGCAVVVDRTVYRGSHGGAGEIGHLPITVDGPKCGCGARGCLEAHIGNEALARQGRAAGLVDAGGGVAQLLEAARAGEPDASEIYRQAGGVLGRALAGVVHTVDPEAVVLLGEGIDAWPFWEPGFEPSFRRSLLPPRRGLPFVIEPWAEDRWALGAAALVLASPFDVAGATGEQGRLVRERLGARNDEVAM